MANLYNVTLTWSGVLAEDAEEAADQFQSLLGITLPAGVVLDVVDDVTGLEVEVEVARGSAQERCPVCGQPDNCGDCTHEPIEEDK